LGNVGVTPESRRDSHGTARQLRADTVEKGLVIFGEQ
jgi:hypothetical protein